MSRDTLALYPALEALTPAARARLLLSSQQIKLPAGVQVFDEQQQSIVRLSTVLSRF